LRNALEELLLLLEMDTGDTQIPVKTSTNAITKTALPKRRNTRHTVVIIFVERDTQELLAKVVTSMEHFGVKSISRKA